MAKIKENSLVDPYFNKLKQWQQESLAMRKILINCGLDESLKWGKPCYGIGDKNVVIIQGFKSYFALLFFKGMLMKDPYNMLVKTGINTRVGRQLRFQGVDEIDKHKPQIIAYLKQAMTLENSGIKIPVKEKIELEYPEELNNKLKKDPSLKKAFQNLSPGRRNSYLFYFSQAKQTATRELRISNSVPKILAGRGLNDR